MQLCSPGVVCRMPQGLILTVTKDDIADHFYDYQMLFCFHLVLVWVIWNLSCLNHIFSNYRHSRRHLKIQITLHTDAKKYAFLKAVGISFFQLKAVFESFTTGNISIYLCFLIFYLRKNMQQNPLNSRKEEHFVLMVIYI